MSVRAVSAAIAFLLAGTGPLLACPAGNPRCPTTSSGDLFARTAPFTRADIDARIGTPGPPVVDEVARDVSRSWEAVRRQSPPPAIAYPSPRPQMEGKGDMP